MAERITGNNFDEKVLKNELPVLVDFYSDSCVPCKMLAPVLGELEEDREGQLAVYKVNVNFDAELAENYGVMAAPTLVLFSQGEIKGKRTGTVKRDVLTEWIDESLRN